MTEVGRFDISLLIQMAGWTADRSSFRLMHSTRARIVLDASTVFEQAEMVLHVKELQPAEIPRCSAPDELLFTYLHLAPDPEQTRGLCGPPAQPASPTRRSRMPTAACRCWRR